MDISAINPSAAQQAGGFIGGAAKNSEPTVARNSQVQDAPVEVPAVEAADIKLSDEKRESAVRKAASSFFKDVFVVNDSKFTIFKDTTGQYVTRFTNLRDGSVTYVPEPDILRYMESKSQQREALLEINA